MVLLSRGACTKVTVVVGFFVGGCLHAFFECRDYSNMLFFLPPPFVSRAIIDCGVLVNHKGIYVETRHNLMCSIANGPPDFTPCVLLYEDVYNQAPYRLWIKCFGGTAHCSSCSRASANMVNGMSRLAQPKKANWWTSPS